MGLFGRRQIFTAESEINEGNIVDVLSDAIPIHEKNRKDIEFLRKYRDGSQPILDRKKEVRPEICNKVVENIALWIVSFRTGYFLGEPIQYVSSNGSSVPSDSIRRLNDMMEMESKDAKDNELAEDQNTVGTAYRLVLPKKNAEDDDAPFDLYTLDPISTFVIRSSDITKRVLAGVYYVTNADGENLYHVYTKNRFFIVRRSNPTLSGGMSIDTSESHILGDVPIIEYPANSSRLGAFEPVIPLLDAINNLESNRVDSVEQFVQSLLVLTNCAIPEDLTANDIRQAGLIQLKSYGDSKASVDVIAEVLDQSQNQTLKDDLLKAVMTIVGMPSQTDGKTSDSSNNGAVILRNGWQSAEARAKSAEQLFKRSERDMIRIVLKICDANPSIDIDLSVSDVAIKFTRRNYEDIMSKSTVLTSMLGNNRIAPIDAFTACGMFPDPEEACKRGNDYYESMKDAEPKDGGDDGDEPSVSGKTYIAGYYR